MKVLIVDDVQIARINMRKALEKEGIEVLEVESGKKALNIFSNEKPDVVALDIDLPGIDGVEVLREIKSIDKNAKVVMVTGLGSQQHFVECLKYGADSFLVKPVDLNKFVDVIKSFGK